ncbi:uncharacterized protein LOC120335877 [Styela clava]
MMSQSEPGIRRVAISNQMSGFSAYPTVSTNNVRNTDLSTIMIQTNAISRTTTELNKQPVFGALVTVQATIGMYLLVAMLYSEWKLRDASSSTSQMHAKRLRQVCLFATSVGTTHLIVNVIALLAPASHKSCILRLAVQKVTYCFGMFAVYAFLWLRQKLFYSNPSLKYLYNKALRFCSWSVFAVIIICFAAQCTMTVIGVLYSEEESNSSISNEENLLCVNPQKRLWTIQITLASITSSIVHISLMGLFIYPMWRHKLQTSSLFVRGHNGSFVSRSSVPLPNSNSGDDPQMKKNSLLRNSLRKTFSNESGGIVIRSPSTSLSANGSNPNTPLNGRKIGRSDSQSKKRAKYVHDRLRALIKRCLLLAITCVVTSISVTIITAVFYRGGLLATFLYGSNMLINMICCTGCFHNWCHTLCPFCKHKKKRRPRGSFTTSNRNDITSQRPSRQFDSIV